MFINTEIGAEPSYWNDACDFLAQNDKVLKNIIQDNRDLKLTRRNPPFHTLARAIVGQQISVHAADAIWNKLTSHMDKETIDTYDVLNIDESTYRELGFSRSKQSYIKNAARFFEDNHPNNVIEDITNLEDKLIEIKGVGKWTAEMFMIFYAHHPDILPLGDIGLLKAIKHNYKDYKQLDYKELKPIAGKLAQNWRPYSTVATLFLWKSIDPVSVEY
jgi:DNA-3-methyladenine glycosylase II